MENHEHGPLNHEGHMHPEASAEKAGGKNGWHLACCVGPVLSWLLWIASATAFVLAWVSVFRIEFIWGLGPEWWLWNALVFGVLALPGCSRKMSRHGHHDICC